MRERDRPEDDDEEDEAEEDDKDDSDEEESESDEAAASSWRRCSICQSNSVSVASMTRKRRARLTIIAGAFFKCSRIPSVTAPNPILVKKLMENLVFLGLSMGNI